MKELTIEIPEGYEIDVKNSTSKCIKFIPVFSEVPKDISECKVECASCEVIKINPI